MITNRMLNAAADAAAALATEVSLHTAEPSSEGSNEVTGGDYERQPVEFAAAEGGAAYATTNPTFSVPGGQASAWVGLWDGRGFLAGGRLASPADLEADYTYQVSPLAVRVRDTTNGNGNDVTGLRMSVDASGRTV